MKKDYLKPTARSHELRCRSMVAQSPLQEEAKLPIMRSDPYGGTDDDSDEMIIWAD